MSSLLSISEAASLGLHAAMLLAAEPERRRSTADLASALGASPAHLAKVLGRLARAGLVRSTRGPGGGSVLAQPPEDVALLQIYEAVDGPLPEARCLLAVPICGGRCCLLGDLLQRTSETLRAHLSTTKLSELLPCPPRVDAEARPAVRPGRTRRS